jgi:O-antigen ligase
MTFLFATVLTGITGLGVIVRYWEIFYIQASLYARIPQYTTAIHLGIQYFPLGMGIDAYYPTVHNFFLDYLVEVGIVGAGAFLALVIVWCRDVLLRSLCDPSRIDPFECAFIAIFGTYVLVMLFQPVPVRRFWWILFGASWAIVLDRLTTSTSRI